MADMTKRMIGPGIRESVGVEDNQLHIKTEQRVDYILEETHRRRRDKTVRDAPGIGRPALTIPEVVFKKLIRDNPDLDARKNAHEDVTRAWLKYMASPESKPWRNFDKI